MAGAPPGRSTGLNVRQPPTGPLSKPVAESPSKGAARKGDFEDEWDVNFDQYDEKTGTSAPVAAGDFVASLVDWPKQIEALQDKSSFGKATILNDGMPVLTQDQLRAMQAHISRTADPDEQKKLFELASTYAVTTPDVHAKIQNQSSAAARAVHVGADYADVAGNLDVPTIRRRMQIMYENFDMKDAAAGVGDADAIQLLKKCGRTPEEGLIEVEAGRVIPFWFRKRNPNLYEGKGDGKGRMGYGEAAKFAMENRLSGTLGSTSWGGGGDVVGSKEASPQ